MDIIDEILEKYKIRFFPWQKELFREYIMEEMRKLDYEVNIIKNNIVIGDIESSNNVYTAHYDTPGTLGILFAWLFKLLGVNRQLLISIILIAMFLIFNLLNISWLTLLIVAILLFSLIQVFIPNKNNCNDNTSGVLAVLLLAVKYKENYMKDAVFILFNNEEWGLLGSASYKRYLKKNDIALKNKKIINLDCVGTGDKILISYKEAHILAGNMKDKLESKLNEEVHLHEYKSLPLSDDYTFRKENAIGIIRVSESIVPKGFYIKNMHTSKDNYIDMNKIQSLTDFLLDNI